MENCDKAILPLAGVRVIEFSHMVMGPAAGLMLADLGADVIKVEPLGGDKTRTLRGSGAGYFVMYNRNKRSIRIDLKSPRGADIARKLIAGADVLIENFRPGTMDKLGFGYERLAAENERLIYCSNRGFLTGPYEQRTALDEVAQMMGGLAYMTGPPGRPLRAGASVVDVMGGMFGVLGILAALEERHRTGRGRRVTSSLFESAVFLVGQHMAQYAVTGTPAQPMPARISAWLIYDVFATADDERVFVGVVSDGQWLTFCRDFGFTELLEDTSLRANNARIEQRDRILPIVRQRFATLSAAELMRKLEESGLPFAPIARPEDLFDDPHLQQSGGLLDITTPDNVNTRLPALPLEFADGRPRVERQPPRSGEHTREVLLECGFDQRSIDSLEADGIVSAG